MKTRNLVSSMLLFAALPATVLAAQGRTTTEARNAFSVEVLLPICVPIGLLAGERGVAIPVQVQYQRVVAEHLVLLVKAGLIYDWTLPPRQPERELSVFPVVELDWHPFRTGLRGPYLGLSGIFDYTAVFAGAGAATATAIGYRFGLGPTVGWQFLLPANITIDSAFGLGFGPAVGVDADGPGTSRLLWGITRGKVFLGFRF
jgi:hypothetical protein